MDSASRRPRVVVVAEDPLARGGVVALAESAGADVVGRGSTRELRELVRETRPDVILWDAPRDSGSESAASEVPLLALVVEQSDLGGLLGAGARGVLLRDVEAPRLTSAIHAVADGHIVIDAELAEALRAQVPASRALDEPLTPREMEVLGLLALGLSNKEVAARLSISDHTAKFHVNAILAKTGAQSRTEAVVRAARLGLLTL